MSQTAPISVSSNNTLERLIVYSLLALHAVAFALITAMNPRYMTDDTLRYIDLADALTRGSFGLMTPNGFEPEGMRSFGYPVFLLICYALFGKSDLGVIAVQGILYLVSVFLIWNLVKKNFGRETSFIFLALSVIYPFIAYSSSLMGPENPCIFLLALAAWVLDFGIRKNAVYTGFALAGFLLALSMYFRSNLFPLPFFLAFVFLFVLRTNRKAVLVLVAAAILTLLPASIYNYRNFGKLTPTPVYGGAGISLWMSTWHARVSTETLIKYRRKIETTEQLKSSGMFEQMAEANRKSGVSEDFFPISMGYYKTNEIRARAQDEYLKAAIENVKTAPVTYFGSSLINVFRMWFSAYIYENYPLPLRLYLLFIGFFAFLAGLIGILFAVRNYELAFSPFVVTALATMVFHSITLCWLHVEARYTIPARFFLLAFAAYGIFRFYELVKRRFASRIL